MDHQDARTLYPTKSAITFWQVEDARDIVNGKEGRGRGVGERGKEREGRGGQGEGGSLKKCIGGCPEKKNTCMLE